MYSLYFLEFAMRRGINCYVSTVQGVMVMSCYVLVYCVSPVILALLVLVLHTQHSTYTVVWKEIIFTDSCCRSVAKVNAYSVF